MHGGAGVGVRRLGWSTLPTKPAEMGCQITYWYGEEEKQARHSNGCFIKQYFPQVELHEIPKMVHCYCMLPCFKEAREDFAKITDILKK